MNTKGIIYYIDDTPLNLDIQVVKSLLRIELAACKELEMLWDKLVREYHYLSYERMIGPRVKYIVWLDKRAIAAISYSQAAYKLEARDLFIDWNEEEKKIYLPNILNNNRFLILPWVHIKNLASHILSLSIGQLKQDWPKIYQKVPYLIETFVDLEKYDGTCYRASNWKYIGETKGYGKIGATYQYHGKRKGVFLYTIKKNFKKLIGCTGRPVRPIRVLKKNNKYLGMVNMQLQKNDWHEGIMEEANVCGVVDKLAEMLGNFMNRFESCFHRSEQTYNVNVYIKGLLSNLERKSAEPIALEYIENPRGARNLQFFMKDAKWDDEGVEKIYQEGLSERICEPEGMITVDESGFVKKGNHSAGVARQYCGSVGKVENSQVGVFVGYSGSKGYGLISSRLFMPEKWFGDDYEKLRTECTIPEDLKFKTKPQIATELINKIEQTGLFKAKWIGMDCLYGNSKEFLDSISKKYLYFADIHKDALVWRTEPVFEVPEYKGRGPQPQKMVATTKPETVSKIAGDENIPWQNMYLGEGSKGPIYSDVKCLRIFRKFENVDNGEISIESCWLFIRRSEDGQVRFSVSNAPVNTSVDELCKASLMRWPIEQCFNEAKDELGMDHYEGRSWAAWHRHMLLVFIASAFLLEIRLLVTIKKK